MWGWLREGDAFEGDWYGELTNQCGHTLLGIGTGAIVAIMWQAIFGEMPVRWMAFIAIVGLYGVIVEWWLQGWKAGDSWFDTLMVACGVGAVYLPFREIAAETPGVFLRLDDRQLAFLITVWAVALTVRVLNRRKRPPKCSICGKG